MNKRLHIIIFVIFNILTVSCYADVNIGVADITAPSKNVQLPKFINDYESSIGDNNTQQALEAQLSLISSQIRKQISLKFPNVKVLDLESDLVTTLNTNYNQEIPESQLNNETVLNLNNDKTILSNLNSQTPEFFMVGRVIAINAGDEKIKIDGTNKYSDNYNLDAAVVFKILRTSDKKIIASFTSVGQAGAVQFISQNVAPKYDVSKLIKSASDDLVNSTISQFNMILLSGKISLEPQIESSPTTK